MAVRNSKGQFKKGYSGKPKGAKHKKTKQWDMIGQYLTEEGSKKFAEIMTNSKDKEFMGYYLAILEYFKPKRSRQETEVSGGQTINVVYNEPIDKPDTGK